MEAQLPLAKIPSPDKKKALEETWHSGYGIDVSCIKCFEVDRIDMCDEYVQGGYRR